MTPYLIAQNVIAFKCRQAPYLPYGEGVLPPSAEASSEPSAHPYI